MFVPMLVLALGLCCCSQENRASILGIPLLYGPSEALLRQVVHFVCDVINYPENETIHLQMYKVGHYEKLLGEYTHQPGQLGEIPMLITENHEGFLECVAKPLNASSSNITATVSDPHYLKVIVPVKNAEIEYAATLELIEEDMLELHCGLEAGNHVSYKWLLNGELISQPPSDHVADDWLMISRVTSRDSGFYTCIASNTFNNTLVFISRSPELEITVKELVSNLSISFTVLKENQNYSAAVTCQSARGSPPIAFSLYNRTELVSGVIVQERHVTFKVPLVLGQHLVWLECQANNSDKITHSPWMPLKVVQVIGPVTLTYDNDIGENYAVIGLRFYCRAAEGSHPRYQWFHNKTLLHNRGSFHHVVDRPPEQSMLLLSVGASSAGTYHCEVSDSFDNTTAISSNNKYVDKDVLNRLSSLVVAVVFGCFTAVIILVSICCCIGVKYRRRVYAEKSLLTLEMERLAAYEDELESVAYTEAPDVVDIASEDNFDEVSEAFVDEWPQTEEGQGEPL